MSVQLIMARLSTLALHYNGGAHAARSLAISWTIMATIVAAVLVAPAFVLRRRAAGRSRHASGKDGMRDALE